MEEVFTEGFEMSEEVTFESSFSELIRTLNLQNYVILFWSLIGALRVVVCPSSQQMALPSIVVLSVQPELNQTQ